MTNKIAAISFLTLFAFTLQTEAQVKKNQQGISRDSKGTLFFEETKLDFGKINETDGKVTKNFEYRNVSNFPVKIIAVETGCGCTVSDFNKAEIQPREMGVLKISFDPLNRVGKLDKNIAVRTNGMPEYIYLNIFGEVTNPKTEKLALYPAVQGNTRFNTYNVNFNKILDTGRDSAAIMILNNSGKMMHISSIKTPPFMRGEISKTAIFPDEISVVKLIYYGDVVNDYGYRHDIVYIQTTDDTLPLKMVNVRSTIVQDFSKLTESEKSNPPVAVLPETVLDFGEVYLGEVVAKEIKITNKGKRNLVIKKVKGTCGCTVGEYTKDFIKKGKTGSIILKFNSAGMRGNIAKDVQIHVNDPKNPVLTVKIKAKVVIPGIDANTN
jgi:hypothetical protein